MRFRASWPLVALASACLAISAGSFAAALFSDPIPRGSTTYAPGVHTFWQTEIFGRATSLSWAEDRSFLLVAIVLAGASLVLYAIAARSRPAV